MLERKRKVVKIELLIGVCLILGSLLMYSLSIEGEFLSRINSLLLALGCGCLGGSLGGFYQIKKLERNPKMIELFEISAEDERNKMIRYMANSKAGDITNWMLLVIAYISIIMGLPVWISILLISVFVLKYVLWFFYIKKYNDCM